MLGEIKLSNLRIWFSNGLVQPPTRSEPTKPQWIYVFGAKFLCVFGIGTPFFVEAMGCSFLGFFLFILPCSKSTPSGFFSWETLRPKDLINGWGDVSDIPFPDVWGLPCRMVDFHPQKNWWLSFPVAPGMAELVVAASGFLAKKTFQGNGGIDQLTLVVCSMWGLWYYPVIWVFPKIGVPPNHPF